MESLTSLQTVQIMSPVCFKRTSSSNKIKSDVEKCDKKENEGPENLPKFLKNCHSLQILRSHFLIVFTSLMSGSRISVKP